MSFGLGLVERDIIWGGIGEEGCNLGWDCWRGMSFGLGLVESDFICVVIGGE